MRHEMLLDPIERADGGGRNEDHLKRMRRRIGEVWSQISSDPLCKGKGPGLVQHIKAGKVDVIHDVDGSGFRQEQITSCSLPSEMWIKREFGSVCIFVRKSMVVDSSGPKLRRVLAWVIAAGQRRMDQSFDQVSMSRRLSRYQLGAMEFGKPGDRRHSIRVKGPWQEVELSEQGLRCS